ncbi:hypothetical protein M408DRAFT_29058 [Serendipita vermifera MAFF 305830]|uniref:Uncharacterized protein n=1 Tax=Serendipita vermifera MAFF 305830 TaxID=933852 RepID=A0A0C3AS12_SERVB|nr:hypothetical protein M408DRAFT_29058 [Serendipita vermifera MAFF 305830]
MRLALIASIVSASLSQSVFALMVERASLDGLEPFLGVPSQVIQGEYAAISMANPPQAISKITLNLKAPNVRKQERLPLSLQHDSASLDKRFLNLLEGAWSNSIIKLATGLYFCM